MKIKKFEARTEQEALEAVRGELGAEAIILNIKKVMPKGILSIFRKSVVEITAAFEERSLQKQIVKSDDFFGEDLSAETAAMISISESAKNKASYKQKKSTPNYETTIKSMTQIDNDTIEKSYSDQRAENYTGEKDFNEVIKEITISEQKVLIKDLERQLKSTEENLAKMSKQLVTSINKINSGNKKYKAPVVQMFYETLTDRKSVV